MKLGYLVGKFRGKTPWEVHCNVHEAEKCAHEVAHRGVFPVTPHKNTEHFDGLLDDGFWLDGTLTVMLRCDCVVVTPNWRSSSGSKKEIEAAVKACLPIFWFDPDRAIGQLGLDHLEVWARREAA